MLSLLGSLVTWRHRSEGHRPARPRQIGSLSFDILPICGGGSRVSVMVLVTTPLVLNVFSLCVCDLCMLCLDATGCPKISLWINKVSIHPSKIKFLLTTHESYELLTCITGKREPYCKVWNKSSSINQFLSCITGKGSLIVKCETNHHLLISYYHL